MHRLEIALGLALGLLVAGFAAPLANADRGPLPSVPQMYNVGFWDMPQTFSTEYNGAEILSVNYAIDFISVVTGNPVLFELRAMLDENVRYVNKDWPDAMSALLIPNDPSYGSQYGWGRIKAPTAWDTTLGSTAVTVAIIDTGIQATHPDLGGARVLSPGMTCAGGDPRNDDNGHGTHVAGTVGATTNNGVGVAGASQSNLLPVKVLNSAGSGTFACVASGITFAADNGAHVLSMSLGCNQPCFDQATSDAINYARNTKGAIVVVAAGNANGAAVGYPGSDPNSFTVSCSTSTDAICSFSSLGPQVDVAAPGSSILSTCIGSTYCTKSGTSMSTPHVSGVAALVKTVNPTWTGAEIETQLRNTAVDLGAAGFDNSYGWGLLDAAAAVGAAPPPPPPPSGTVHVSAIAGSFTHTSNNKHNLVCSVTIVDSAGAAQSGATVSLTWTKPDGKQTLETATTSASGVATFNLNNQRVHGTYTCAVTNVTLTGFTYDPAANVVTSQSVAVT